MGLQNTALDRLEHFIHRYFLGMIVASYAVATLMPGFGLWLRGVRFGAAGGLEWSLPSLMLASLLFNAGLGVKTRELRHLLRNPGMVLGGVCGNLLMPLAFIAALSAALSLWHNPEEVQQILVGLALVASMPIAGASTAWAQNANGNLALSLGLVLSTTLLSPLLTPLALHAVGFVTRGDYSDDLHELASEGVVGFLGAWVILPSLLGILLHGLVGEHRLAPVKPFLKLVNFGVLLLLNYSNAALTLPGALSEPDFDFLAVILVIVVALCAATFAAGYWLGRVFRAERGDRVSLMFGLGMSNNGTGLVLASLALADHPGVMLPVIFYNLAQHLVASTVDGAVARRHPA